MALEGRLMKLMGASDSIESDFLDIDVRSFRRFFRFVLIFCFGSTVLFFLSPDCV